MGGLRSTESTPCMQSTAHGPPDLFIEHLSKAEVHFLVLRCLNLYSLKCIITKYEVLLGALLQFGALSARLVRLWVNPALSWNVSYCIDQANEQQEYVDIISPINGLINYLAYSLALSWGVEGSKRGAVAPPTPRTDPDIRVGIIAMNSELNRENRVADWSPQTQGRSDGGISEFILQNQPK